MRRITIFDIQYNTWNGYRFEILGFETENFDQRALLSIDFGRGWFCFGLLYINFFKTF